MWIFRLYKLHSFLRLSVIPCTRNIFICLFLISSLLFSQEQGNTVAVLVFEGRGISLSNTTERKFADPQNNPIEILSFGEGVIDAQ